MKDENEKRSRKKVHPPIPKREGRSVPNGSSKGDCGPCFPKPPDRPFGMMNDECGRMKAPAHPKAGRQNIVSRRDRGVRGGLLVGPEPASQSMLTGASLSKNRFSSSKGISQQPISLREWPEGPTRTGHTTHPVCHSTGQCRFSGRSEA